jgi:hypothetical protein
MIYILQGLCLFSPLHSKKKETTWYSQQSSDPAPQMREILHS